MNKQTNPILIIDDDAFQRRMIRIKLQTHGYEVNEAKDGVEALDFLAEQNYSMILLDIVMPQLNGWEVLDQIRNTLTDEKLPVIMMTAEDTNYDSEAARKRGATAYLTKPINFVKLNELLDKYVNSASENHPVSQNGDPTETPQAPELKNPEDIGSQTFTKPVSSLLDGMIQILPGIFFRAIGDTEHNVQLNYETTSLKTFLGQEWGCVQEIFSVLEPHDRHEVNRLFRENAITSSPIFLRFPCKTNTGKIGWIECRAIPHRLSPNETLWDAVLLDVTEQKELEFAAIRSREAAKNNPTPEHLPLLEMYRRFHAAWSAGEDTAELSKNIAELEQALRPTLDKTASSTPDDAAPEMPFSTYRDGTGYIHQCAQCRRVQNFSADGAWERVASLTHEMPLKTSHTICPECAEVDQLLTTE